MIGPLESIYDGRLTEPHHREIDLCVCSVDHLDNYIISFRVLACLLATPGIVEMRLNFSGEHGGLIF